MPAHLLSLTDGPSILIDKPVLLFGRHQECDVQLNSRKVSRRHCCIAQVSDYLVVRDLGSTNGIRINGRKVTEGKLHPGDELTIGNFRYQVCGDVIGRPVAMARPVARAEKGWGPPRGTPPGPRRVTSGSPPPPPAPRSAPRSAAPRHR